MRELPLSRRPLDTSNLLEHLLLSKSTLSSQSTQARFNQCHVPQSLFCFITIEPRVE